MGGESASLQGQSAGIITPQPSALKLPFFGAICIICQTLTRKEAEHVRS